MRRALPILFLLAACASQPNPPPPLLTAPAIQSSSTHYSGSPLSGPTTRPITNIANALHVDIRWVALATMPTQSTTPLSSKARLIIDSNSGALLRGSPKRTASIRFVEDADTLANVWAGPRLSTLAPLQNVVTSVLPGATTAAVVHAGNTDFEFRIAIGSASIGNQSPLFCTFAVGSGFQNETVVFDESAIDQKKSFAVLVPDAFAGPATVLGLSVTIRSLTSNAADAAAVAQSLTDAQSSARILATQPTLLSSGVSQSTGIAAAVDSLSNESLRRSALVYLADQTNAPLCQETSLVADEAVLADLTQRISGAVHTADPQSADHLGWILDRSAFELLVSLADSPEQTKFSPELASVLTEFAGESARHTASLDEINHGLSDQSDLQNRIIAQNLLFLTDTSPAARVRAFDWLSSRKLAPAAFDPLGNPHDRRVALDRATNPATNPATSQP